MHHMNARVLVLTGAAMLVACPLSAQQIEFSKEKKAVVRHYDFPGNHREESMWSALYGAKSGKIDIGLCTHAEAAHFYEFDPATETMRHIVDPEFDTLIFKNVLLAQ